MLVRRAAETVLADTADLAGYPTTLEVGYRGKTLTLSGLAPDAATQRRVNEALRQELPDTRIDTRLAVIPTTDVDLRPVEQRMATRLASLEREMTSAATLRALARAETRLAETQTALERLDAGPASTLNPLKLPRPAKPSRRCWPTLRRCAKRRRPRRRPSGPSPLR